MLKQMIREVLSEAVKYSFLSKALGGKSFTSPEDFTKDDAKVLKGMSRDEIQKKAPYMKVISDVRALLGYNLAQAIALVNDGKLADPDPEPESEPEPPEEEGDFTLDDPIGSFKVSAKGLPNISGDPKDPRNIVLKALKDAFKAVNADLINLIAKLDHDKPDLVPSFLTEDIDKLELEDLGVLFNLDPEEVLGAEKALEVAKKVELALNNYIKTGIKDKIPGFSTDNIADMVKVKNMYKKIVTKGLGYVPPGAEAGILQDIPIPATGEVEPDHVSGGKMFAIDPEIINIFSNFFAGTTDIKSRIDKLSKLQETILSGGGDASLSDVAFGAPIVQMFERFMRKLQPTAGGTEIESLLALLVAGKKVGGSGGAGDFVGPDGTEYSLKTFKKGTQVKQNSFNNALGKDLRNGVPDKKREIVYVLVLKEKRDGKTYSGVEKYKGVEGGYRQVVALSFYAVKLVHFPKGDKGAPKVSKTQATLASYSHETGKLINSTRARPDKLKANGWGDNWVGTAVGLAGSPKIESVIAKLPRDAFLGRVPLVNSMDDSFLQAYDEFVNNTAQKPLQLLSSIYRQTKNISNSSRELFADKDLTTGYDMASNYASLKEDLNLLITEILGGEAVGQIGLTENKNKKKSKKDLDNLIKEVILKRLLK